MSKLSIIKELNNLNFKDISSSIKKIESLESSQDVLYHANLIIFQSSTINHKERLSFLKKTNNLSIKYKLPFCNAHSMTLLIKVCRELGIQKKIIEDSHCTIKLWKSILGEPLAVNGLIFTYIDLGLIYSDYNLNMLGLEYLNKAESLLSECDNEYYPFSKLYVAYAILYNKIKKYKKSESCYNKVIKLAESKKDTLMLVPILVNMADDSIRIKNYNQAKKRCQKALKISDSHKEEIYKPYIYYSLGCVYMETNNYKKSKYYIDKALFLFDKMNIVKMIPKGLYYLGRILYKEKKYNDAISIFSKSLSENKKLDNYDLDIKLLKKASQIHKINNNEKLFLDTINSLNQVLEKQIKNKDKLFSDTNTNALKHLSQEFNFSLEKHKELKLKFDLESKKRKLTTDALISVSEREFLKNIIDKLNIQQLDNQKIIQLCRQRMQHTKDWNIFMKLFNDIHPYFNQYIIKKCPTITESELRICNLIKMSFSSLEITEILSISKRGVEQHRYRIRKKLDIKTDLTIFLQSI